MDNTPTRYNTTRTQVRADCLKCANWAMEAPSREGKPAHEIPPIEDVYLEVEHAAHLHTQECAGPWT